MGNDIKPHHSLGRNLVSSRQRPGSIYIPFPKAYRRMGRDSAQKRLHAVQAILKSPEHYDETPTRNYGAMTPMHVTALLRDCGCGRTPTCAFEAPDYGHVLEDEYGIPRKIWIVRCVCGAKTSPYRMRADAVCAWNGLPSTSRYTVAEFPFFNLAAFPLDVARARLLAIKRDLDLRIEESLLQVFLNTDPAPGSLYVQKLVSYRSWCRLALETVDREISAATGDVPRESGEPEDD